METTVIIYTLAISVATIIVLGFLYVYAQAIGSRSTKYKYNRMSSDATAESRVLRGTTDPDNSRSGVRQTAAGRRAQGSVRQREEDTNGHHMETSMRDCPPRNPVGASGTESNAKRRLRGVTPAHERIEDECRALLATLRTHESTSQDDPSVADACGKALGQIRALLEAFDTEFAEDRRGQVTAMTLCCKAIIELDVSASLSRPDGSCSPLPQ